MSPSEFARVQKMVEAGAESTLSLVVNAIEQERAACAAYVRSLGHSAAKPDSGAASSAVADRIAAGEHHK